MGSQRVGHDWAAFTSLSAEGVPPASSGERPWMLLNIPQGTEQRPHPRQRIILSCLVGRSHVRILYTNVALSWAREMQWISQKGRADLALQSREDEAVKSTCTGQEPPTPPPRVSTGILSCHTSSLPLTVSLATSSHFVVSAHVKV